MSLERFWEISKLRYFAGVVASSCVLRETYLCMIGDFDLVMCNTWHVEGLKSMPHFVSHMSSSSRYFCKMCLSVAFVNCYITSKHLLGNIFRQIINIEKDMIGPSTEPWGPPY